MMCRSRSVWPIREFEAVPQPFSHADLQLIMLLSISTHKPHMQLFCSSSFRVFKALVLEEFERELFLFKNMLFIELLTSLSHGKPAHRTHKKQDESLAACVHIHAVFPRSPGQLCN